MTCALTVHCYHAALVVVHTNKFINLVFFENWIFVVGSYGEILKIGYGNMRLIESTFKSYSWVSWRSAYRKINHFLAHIGFVTIQKLKEKDDSVNLRQKTTVLMFNLLLFTLPLKLVSAVVNHGHTIPTGTAHFSMWTMIPAGIANVLLDFILIAKFGFLGVIYATLICYTFANISFMCLYYLKINRLVVNAKS